MLRKARYALEALVLLPGLLFFRLLPLDIASALGGWLARVIGPFLRVHRIADNNLMLAMPEMSLEQRRRILRDMWDNLGRTIGEYPHLSRKVMAQRITVEGREYLDVVKASGKGAFFVSGHFANWEIAPLTAAIHGWPLVLVYRAANNPIANWVIRRIRSSYNRDMHNKGREGAREIVKAIKEGKAVAMLLDQKMNDGIAVPFFGRDAMTAPAVAQMAAKYNVPILAAHVVRTDGVHFHVTVEPPFMCDPADDEIVTMRKLHVLFEKWIREHPAQWFWVHRRWG